MILRMPNVGESVRQYVMRTLWPWLASERLVSVVGGELRSCAGGGKTITIRHPDSTGEPWDIMKTDGASGYVWIRKGRLVHHAGASSVTYELSGDGTDTTSTGYTLGGSGVRYVWAQLNIGSPSTLTLGDADDLPTDDEDTIHFLLWKLDWTDGNIYRVERMRRGTIDTTVFALLNSWDDEETQYVKHHTDGVLEWIDANSCPQPE